MILYGLYELLVRSKTCTQATESYLIMFVNEYKLIQSVRAFLICKRLNQGFLWLPAFI